ncbi:MAG TPA: tetratricopeptide repeat protein [Polyangiaceae bacterium]|nr:tetratricopeptide repeat protein [Polyangiaceae bacterium]
MARRPELLRDLRRAYGLRELVDAVVQIVGAEHAKGMVGRIVGYAMWMLRLPRSSKRSRAEVDRAMYLALAIGTVGRDAVSLKFVDAMLNSVWREEIDPVWRTSLKAATRPWFKRMQDVTAKLPPGDSEHLAAALGEGEPAELVDETRYLCLASNDELARDSVVRIAMDHEAAEDGRFGALELKLRASDASNRGDPLRAIDLLREAVRRDPLNAELHSRLGGELWQIADVDEAMKELELAVQLDPGWDRAHVEIAIVLLNQDRNDEAARRLEQAKPLLRAPSVWLGFYNGAAVSSRPPRTTPQHVVQLGDNTWLKPRS